VADLGAKCSPASTISSFALLTVFRKSIALRVAKSVGKEIVLADYSGD
jgi:hypothetical protein